MFEVALFLYLCQANDPGTLYPSGNSRSTEMQQRKPNFWPVEETNSMSSEAKREADYEEHEFTKRFNALISALSDFACSYNADHTMNVKKVKAVEKAWRKLEKSDWFRPPKGD